MSRLHANMGDFLILNFFLWCREEEPLLFYFSSFWWDTKHCIRSGLFSFCLPTHTRYFNYIAAIWAFKKKKIKKECCSSITVKPQHFFCIGDEHICSFTVVCCCVVVRKWKLLFIQNKTSLLKSTFKCVLKLNNSVIVHCKYCYSLIKMYQSCYGNVSVWIIEDQVDLIMQREQERECFLCVCVCVCVSGQTHIFKDRALQRNVNASLY